ncbi:uncharacterized protein LOC125363270 isoform X1 [Perognathus longimembris pacificus]|uniref:uncharacterized protein LOC125363270 isoform X1 n=1 Tax=Perognathus longimembris pacificus TaxID=214514 RepID=UPI002019A812|nr:uncharacterized protein LOC125363270 isoform X1 [Perognathus longimembris pacificus]
MVAASVMRTLRKNRTLRYGVPMLLLVIGGSFGLREFSQIRYDAVKIKIDPELEKKLKMNKVSLESEYEGWMPDGRPPTLLRLITPLMFPIGHAAAQLIEDSLKNKSSTRKTNQTLAGEAAHHPVGCWHVHSKCSQATSSHEVHEVKWMPTQKGYLNATCQTTATGHKT